MHKFFVLTLIIYCLSSSVSAQRTLVVPDDYPQIQEAIDSAKAGDTVEIKPGTYNEMLVFKNGVDIKGAEQGDVIIRCDANTGSVITINNCSSGSISRLTLEHTDKDKIPDGHKTFFPVVKLSSSSIKISECIIKNSGDNGITIEDRSNCEISDCDIKENRRSGITIYHKFASPFLRNNKCVDNGVNGIYFKEGASGIAEENICNRNGYHGIEVAGRWSSPTIRNNVCSENNVNGICFSDKAQGRVEFNTCSKNKWHGISILDASSSPVLSYNKCINNKRCGIYFSRHMHITAEGNVLKGNGEINFRQLRNVLWAEKFDELEKTISKLRKEKSRFMNGNWQLNHFYYSLGGDWSGYNPSVEHKLFKILKNWMKQKPESITPRIVMARAYKDYAWHARGGNYRDRVSMEMFDIFQEKLNKAWSILVDAEKLSGNDPELYNMFVCIGSGLGKPKKEINQFFEKGVTVEPCYYPLYYSRANYLLPRWGGYPNELEQFARHAEELTREFKEEFMYARIAADAICKFNNKGHEQFKNLGFSYPKIKEGHIGILKKYPEATYFRNSYCLLASVYKDREPAQKLFDEIGDNWNRTVWCKIEHFNRYKNWALDLEGRSQKEE